MTTLLPGRATPEGTAAYRARLDGQVAEGHFRRFHELHLSSVGLGTYLGRDDAEDDALYHAATLRTLELGSNVIDCAINYRSQRSERAVGAALAEAIADGRVRRDEVLVTTKGGYLPFDGRRPPNLHDYIEETYLRPGILRTEELVEGCHCMTPRYLEDQIERSRRNLGLATLDVYYLHNPETQLEAVPRADFLGRVRDAFALLERAASDGRIGLYGMATWNGFRQPVGAPTALVLEELVAVAREVGGEGHRFRVVQLPCNLSMTEAVTLANQPSPGGTVSFVEAARQAGIYVMTSASILQGRLARNLPASLREALGTLQTDAQRALQVVRSLPGVGTALVGMKHARHVEENLGVAAAAPLEASQATAVIAG